MLLIFMFLVCGHKKCPSWNHDEYNMSILMYDPAQHAHPIVYDRFE